MLRARDDLDPLLRGACRVVERLRVGGEVVRIVLILQSRRLKGLM